MLETQPKKLGRTVEIDETYVGASPGSGAIVPKSRLSSASGNATAISG